MKTTNGRYQKWVLSAVFLCLAGALLAALLAALPLAAEPGLLNTRGGGDSPFLLQRLHQLETALRDGHFPVRWMPDANYGYGYPFYNFYAPLSIYSAAVFRFLGFDLVHAIQLSQAAGFLAAAGGMFVLARRWLGSPWAGLLASVAYTTAPFHMVNVYVRGDSLAEFWAMAFYPLVLLTADWLLESVGSLQSTVYSERFTVNAGRVGSKGSPRRYAALFALAYAALVLSHNISALIFSPFLLLYWLLRGWFYFRGRGVEGKRPFARTVGWTALGLGLGLALAAWFFVPALAEKSLAQLEPVTAGYFHYSNHFRGSDLVQGSLLFDYSVDGGNAFKMGLVQAVTAVSGLLALLFWRKGEAVSPVVRWFVLISLLVSTLMITPLSRLLWEYVPLLSFTQFPWRFLSVQALVAALAAGGLSLLPWRRWLAPLLALLLLASALAALQPDHLLLTDADVTARKLAEYEWFTGNIGSTVSAEYLPPTVQPRPVTSVWLNTGSRDQVVVLNGAAEVTLVERRSVRQQWSVAAAEATTLVFPTLAWPGWLATVDEQAVALQPAPGSGLIQLTVPSGEHLVELRLTRTPVRLAAEWVSGTAVLLLLFLLWPKQQWLPDRRWAVALIGLFLVFVVATLWPSQRLPNSDLNWDFAQMAYLHHADERIPFTDGLWLNAYHYSDNTLRAGETLTIETNWSGEALATAPQVTAALYSPAITRPPILAEVIPPALALDENSAAAERAFLLRLPADIPPGLYVPRLVAAGHQPLTASGLRRGDLFLRPVQVLGGSVAEAAAHRDLDVMVLTAVQRQPEPVLDLHLAWLTAQPLTANYNVSLRLLNATGQWVRQLDTQPGFGFLPSSGWQPGQWTPDWLALTLPELSPEAGPYPLMVQLYDVSAPETAVLTRRLGTVQQENDAWIFQEHQPVYEAPVGIAPLTAVFADEIQLLGYDLSRTAETATLTLFWRALTDGQADYTRFVHLLGTEPGQPPLRQNDSYPVRSSYPTGQWSAGEVVADVVTLDLTDLPAGSYSLVTGFYRLLADGSVGRLTAVAANGEPFSENSVPVTSLKIED